MNNKIDTIKEMIFSEEARVERQVEALEQLLDKTIELLPELEGLNQEEHFGKLEKHPATKCICDQIVLLSHQSAALSDCIRAFKRFNI